MARTIPKVRFKIVCGPIFRSVVGAIHPVAAWLGLYFPTRWYRAYAGTMKRDPELITLLFYSLIAGAIAHGLLRGLMSL